MPLPLNQRTNRDSMALPVRRLVSAAYAVPLLLNIAARGGSPIRTAAPLNPAPLKKVRLDMLLRPICSSLHSRTMRTDARAQEFIGLPRRRQAPRERFYSFRNVL